MPDMPQRIPGVAHRGNWVRLRTLVVLRWIAAAGQITAMIIAQTRLGIDLPLGPCLMLVTLLVLANTAAALVFPVNQRLTEVQVMSMLVFDTLQLLAMVAVTGGLNNPFALLVLAPVTISATALPLRHTVAVCSVAIIGATAVAWFHLPLRMHDGTVLQLSDLFEVGFWVAIVTGVIFVASYAHRVTQEIAAMSQALLATQMALSREQKLTDLGGVVAAAAHELGTPLATIKLTSAEMIDELSDRPDLAQDARLIRDQANRCRDILRAMGRAGKTDGYIVRAPLTEVVREAAEPHLDRGKALHVAVAPGRREADQPQIERRPEIIHGLRNLIQNAVDFAAGNVWIDVDWNGAAVRIRIVDDGPGYPPSIIGRLGDPFLRRREVPDLLRPEYEGMGLGLFIAKTLLERTGAEVTFMNAAESGRGALVSVNWPSSAGFGLDPSRRPVPAENTRITG